MNRRSFLRHLALAGVTINAPLINANTFTSTLPGKFLVVVNAEGAWDPTSICDPKGLNRAYGHKTGVNNGSTNTVGLNSLKRIGSIRWSDVPDNGALNENDMLRVEQQFDDFFQVYGERLTVINGIDTATNSHDVGTRYVWTGSSPLGYPSLSALYAGATYPDLPMSFISDGGYDYTASVVAKARPSNIDFINEIAQPNLTYGDRTLLFKNEYQDIYSVIEEAQKEEINRLRNENSLPKKRKQIEQLFGARSSEFSLSDLSSPLNDLEANVLDSDNWNEGRTSNFKAKARLVAAAFKANLAVSANLNVRGFDTHSDHDSSSFPLAGDLLEGIHYLMVALEYLGIRENTTVVVGSDFGRTPYYNVSSGKDHWPLTSMLVLQGSNVVTGGRVFGATSDDFNVEKINVTSGLPDSSGLVLEPAHVNQELRKLLGVADHPLAELFPLPESNFNIFV